MRVTIVSSTMDISIRNIQSHELSLLLELYKHLHPDDPLPEELHLQQVWNQLLSDPKIQCLVVGPHTQWMYQVAFQPDQFAQVVPWLMLHREGLDILVHPNTGDAVADHTNHALWLGNKLAINLEPLRQVSLA